MTARWLSDGGPSAMRDRLAGLKTLIQSSRFNTTENQRKWKEGLGRDGALLQLRDW